jgi:murein L,D-transpeptidase YcbB/YkuD
VDDTDFDVLCDGASPAEAKQLRKLLADWCDGDESSFPVQLALLTRAQWRAAASVPRLVGDARELLLLKLDERMHTIQTAFDDLDEATLARLDALKQIETEDSAKRREAIAVIEAQMLKAQAVATMISSDLEKGRTNWVAARNEYDAARQRLESAEQQLQARLNFRDWTVLLLLLLLAGLVGACVALGFYPSSTS